MKRDKSIILRVSQTEFDKIKENAQKIGTTVSQYVRIVALQDLKLKIENE